MRSEDRNKKGLWLILLLSNLIASASIQAQFVKLNRVLYFDFAKSELNQNATDRLSQLNDSIIGKNDVKRVYLYGHCDSIGKSTYNDSLSLRRVLEVKKYLVNLGLPDSIFKVTKGFGKQHPLNVNATEEERSINRRVEMVFIYEPKRKTAVNNRTASIINIDTSNMVVGSKIVLKNIQFEGGVHRFLPGSDTTLKELLTLMLMNPTLEIQIVGYICCMPEKYPDGMDHQTGLYNLSEARARAVYDYLLKYGITRNRLTYKGMGPKNKITQERTPAEESVNRRVEIVITKR